MNANTTTTIPAIVCPLFPVRRVANRSLCPVRVEDLEFPTVQRHERSIVDTNRMYRSFRQMEREGRISSLQPTIVLSTKPQTQLHSVVPHQIVDEEYSRSMKPLSSTLEHAQKKDNVYDEDEMKTNEEWFRSEMKGKKQEESSLFHQQRQQELLSNVSNEDELYSNENESENNANAENADIQQINFDSPTTSSFSLKHLSSMLLAVLLARSVQKSSAEAAERSAGANDGWNDPAAAVDMHGMQVVMVNVALVMC